MTSKNFNIKETVHKSIENNQFPSFSNHRSLIGWCSMNYPKVLENPAYLQKIVSQPNEQFQLQTIFQQKNPHHRKINQFYKPFSNYRDYSKDPTALHEANIKRSSLTLATTKHDIKSQIFEQNNKLSEQYSAVRPMRSMMGQNRDNNFERKIKQIGQITYNPPDEGEQMRHLKKLPNTIINQHNLLAIMDAKLQYLDLQYKTNLSNDLIHTIGYLAPNIKELVLTSVPITDRVLIELGKSCKVLEAIDISLCSALTQLSVDSFLADRAKYLTKFSANHNPHCITDSSLQNLHNCKLLRVIKLSFCTKLTSITFQCFQELRFQAVELANLPNIQGDDFVKVFSNSENTLTSVDISFNPQKEVGNNLMKMLGMCIKLQNLILTGCENIGDQGINNLIYGDKATKNVEGLPELHTLKVGGLVNVSDKVYQLLKRCPLLELFEGNNLERLTDNFIDQTKTHPTLKIVLLNFTPNITEDKLKQVKESVKTMRFVRNIVKMTDPKDDGLRMPIPPASMKVKKPKKKKKK